MHWHELRSNPILPISLNLVLQTAEYVTEEIIHRAFDQFGSVVDVSIKQSAVDQVNYSHQPFTELDYN